MLKTKQIVSLVLVAAAMVFYVLRKTGALYVPCVSSFALAAAMFIVGVDALIHEKQRSRRVLAVLIIAFGLLMVLAGVLEVVNPFVK